MRWLKACEVGHFYKLDFFLYINVCFINIIADADLSGSDFFFIFLKLIFSLKYLVRKGTGSTVYYSKEFNNKNILRLFFSIQYVDLASLAL